MILRDWYIGCALAFQADERGSIPLSRSSFFMLSLKKLLDRWFVLLYNYFHQDGSLTIKYKSF